MEGFSEYHRKSLSAVSKGGERGIPYRVHTCQFSW